MKKTIITLFIALSALISFGQTIPTGTATGVNSYSVASTLPAAPATLSNGIQLMVKVGTTNTTVATLRLGTLATQSVSLNGAAVAAGDIPANVYMLYTYNSSAKSWQLSKPGPSSGVSTTTVVAGANITVTSGVNSYTVTGASASLTNSVTPIASGTVGSILVHGTGDKLMEFNSQLFWDQANSRLGINTDAPLFPIHIKKGIADPHIFLEIEQTNGGADLNAANFRLKGTTRTVDWGLENDKDFLVYNVDSLIFNCYATSSSNFEIGVRDGASVNASKLYVRGYKQSDFILIAKGSAVQGGLGYDANGGYLNINNLAGNLQTVKLSSGGDNWINTGRPLGIGTSTPDNNYKLTVQGTGTYNGIIVKDSDGDINSTLWYYQGEGGAMTILDAAGTTVLTTFNNHFFNFDFTSKDFAIKSNGSKGLLLQSPDGHYWRETISNIGIVTWTDIGTNP